MFRDRRAVWVGTGAVIAGVVLHLPMFPSRRRLEEITAVELHEALEGQ